jgi:hypothetical protein
MKFHWVLIFVCLTVYKSSANSVENTGVNTTVAPIISISQTVSSTESFASTSSKVSTIQTESPTIELPSTTLGSTKINLTSEEPTSTVSQIILSTLSLSTETPETVHPTIPIIHKPDNHHVEIILGIVCLMLAAIILNIIFLK